MKGSYDNKLVKQYTGAGASGYDRQREETPRYRAEEHAFRLLFERSSPAWVVDCPVGTGRWLESYRAVAGSVTGVDASKAMLSEAREKFEKANLSIDLVHGSIFDASLFSGLRRPGKGLVVCVRFLNWIRGDRLDPALEALSSCNPEDMIVGVSVRPDHWGFWRSLSSMMALARSNLVAFLKRNPLPKVHSERSVLQAFSRRGLVVVAREFIHADNARVNYFYLLTRKSA